MKVTGNVHTGFTAEFVPQHVGPHTIAVDYNGHPVYGTPYTCKVYDAKQVIVGNVPRGHVGDTLQFTGKFSRIINYAVDDFNILSP